MQYLVFQMDMYQFRFWFMEEDLLEYGRRFPSILTCISSTQANLTIITYSPILCFPSTQGYSGNKMAIAVSNGARKTARGPLGVREQILSYPVSTTANPMGLLRSALTIEWAQNQETCVRFLGQGGST